MLNSIKRALGISASSEITGSVSAFAGPYAPKGFLDCNGQLLPIGNNYYTPLFSVVGTLYGGDGIKTFALPDLRPVDKKGNKIDWIEAGLPRQVICVNGIYPQRP
jgi:microcystin-dependent protein